MKCVYFIRHGQTQANAEHYVPGADEPLNESGQLQAAQVAARVANLDIDSIVCSSFLRAKQTAAPIVESHTVPVEYNETFREHDAPSSLFGMANDAPEVQQYSQDRLANVANVDWQYEDSESMIDFHARLAQARKYLETHEHDNLLVVSHCFFIVYFVASILLPGKRATRRWFELGKRIKISNTSVSLLTFDEKQWRVNMLNDHSHFAE